MVDFNRDMWEGQMTPSERECMYNVLIEKKPETLFEIGTWKGGGSTYFISSALLENKKGTLYTIECEKKFYDHAINLYNTTLSYLSPYIKFFFGKSEEIYSEILKNIKDIDFLLLDGKEDSNQTIIEYNMFVSHFHSGSLLACHDWNIGKMEKLKPIIKNDKNWTLIKELNEGPTGFCIYIRV